MSKNKALQDDPQDGGEVPRKPGFPTMYCRVTADPGNTLTDVLDETQATIANVMRLVSHMAGELGDQGSQLTANTDDAAAMLWLAHYQLDLLHHLIDSYVANDIRDQAHDQAMAENTMRKAA